MSLLDKLADRAMDEAAERGADWLKKGLRAADDLAAEHLEGEALGAVRVGLEILDKHEKDLVALGVGGLGSFMILMGVGDYTEAKRQLLTALEDATFESLMATSDSATEAVLEQAAERDEAWESIKKIGKELATALLPYLLMAL